MNAIRMYFEDLAPRWDTLQPPDRHETLRRLLAEFHACLSPCDSILEVGTGTGALLPCLKECAPAARLVSIDLAGEMLRRAQQREATSNLLQADVHHLPFAAAPMRWSGFDAVVCHNCFPHFADKRAALYALASVLKPGGHILIIHDASREKINAIHSNAGEAIRHDLLPAGADTRRLLIEAGFVGVWIEDAAHRYLAAGQRG